MIKEAYEAIQRGEDVRQNLSLLRRELKDKSEPAEIDLDVIKELLYEEDPKTRKNAALLLGDLQAQEALLELYHAYEKEEKNFVKSAYLAAMGKLDCTPYLDTFEKLCEKLCEMQPRVEDKKHVDEQVKELEKILLRQRGIKKHKFNGFLKKNRVILTTNRDYREVTKRELTGVRTEDHPLGVLAETEDFNTLLMARTNREILFPLQCEHRMKADAAYIGKELAASDLLSLLKKNHEGEEPFFFRLEIKSSMPLDKKAAFAKKIAQVIEDATKRALINSTTDYEVELRLLQNKEGTFFPCMKLYTLPMKRFSYRKNSIAASIHPARAALIMQLAKPYFTEGAQVLDPCCGVGTMLIERNVLVPTGDMYGLDIYGEAVEKARENAKQAGVRIQYINRDFFDFTHDYLFDEIITNMPVRGRKTKEEQDVFYQRFFAAAADHLKTGGYMILYSNEIGFVKKQLRLDSRYRMQQEYCIQKKDGYYIFIIVFKG